MRDDLMANLDVFEREGLIGPATASSTGVRLYDFPGYRAGPGLPGCSGLRGFAESQELSLASPRMLDEFLLSYLRPIARRFESMSFGCCEALDGRVDLILRAMPNLRVIGVSPWAKQERFADIAPQLILSRRPNPAMVCSRFHEDEIRADIRGTLGLLGHRQLEIVLKDTCTVQGDPGRIARWVAIVREEIGTVFGS